MFSREWTVRWGDGDMFGIAYYPRIVEALHDTADEFMEAQGSPFWELEEQHGIGLPIVKVNVDFEHPVACGDKITIGIEPEVGETSIQFSYVGMNEDETETFSGYEMRACVPFDGDGAVPVPDELRRLLEGEE